MISGVTRMTPKFYLSSMLDFFLQFHYTCTFSSGNLLALYRSEIVEFPIISLEIGSELLFDSFKNQELSHWVIINNHWLSSWFFPHQLMKFGQCVDHFYSTKYPINTFCSLVLHELLVTALTHIFVLLTETHGYHKLRVLSIWIFLKKAKRL